MFVSTDCMNHLREMLDRKDLSGADLYALNEAITALSKRAEPSREAAAFVWPYHGFWARDDGKCNWCGNIEEHKSHAPAGREEPAIAAHPPHCPNCSISLPDLDYRREGTVASWAAPGQSVGKRPAAQQEPGLRQGNPK